ncbi:MAG: helix-turn-helix domain-containing protein [Ktedonobacteraceae bacterium]
MQREQRAWCRKLWEIIYQALTAPRKAEDIARTVGVSASTVHRVIAAYNRGGVAAIETPGKGGRRHQYLTLAQERAFSSRTWPAPLRERSRKSPRSIRLLRSEWDTRSMTVPPIACSIDRAGVSQVLVSRPPPVLLPPRRACGCTRGRFPCGHGGSSCPCHEQRPRNAHRAATPVISPSRSGRSWNR